MGLSRNEYVFPLFVVNFDVGKKKMMNVLFVG